MEKIEPRKVRRNMDKFDPKNAHHEHETGHHRRRSTGSPAFSDSETVPNYLRATRSSCHDRCKSGFISEDEQVTKSSRAARGGHFQKKKKSAVNLEAALDSITRTSKVSRPVISTSTAQQPRRSFSDFVNSRRHRFNEPNETRYTRLVEKKVVASPETSSALKPSRSRIPKKPDNPTTENNRKTKTDSLVFDATLAKEAATSEPVPSEENKIKIKLIRNESEDSGNSARKLKFRGGKVLPEQEEENDTTKLKFRQGLEIQNQDINVLEVTLRKTEIENPENSPMKPTPIVQLTGHVVEENNASQSLYNSLIEETANELSRTKSKVKALVGAFESVISIVDTKSQASKRQYFSIL